MIFTINDYDLFLHRSCDDVDPQSEETAELVAELLSAVDGIGIGLAAPQIGQLKSVAVMNLDHLESRDPAIISKKENMIVTIMPTLLFDIQQGKSLLYSTEGCLSIPGKSFVVPRFPSATLSYFDLAGVLHQRKLTGFAAVVAQHEVDHLNGKLICDTGKLIVPHKETHEELSDCNTDDTLTPTDGGVR
jgi:peptide deformylase